MSTPQGTALYVRRMSKSRHGTPAAFAKKCAEHGLSWIALAGIWQERRKNGVVSSRAMNSRKTLEAYGTALQKAGIEVYLWGYPWLGHERKFHDQMMALAEGWQTHKRILLDPERGSNPPRSKSGSGKAKANLHAALLVSLFAESMTSYQDTLGLSTFGSGWRMQWFPLLAFTKALGEHFAHRTFIGGQTYTDDGAIDNSIADMVKVIVCAKHEGKIDIIPNFGTYSWRTPTGKRAKGAKARSKKKHEFRSHLLEFVNEQEPVTAMIGWAENFMNPTLWDELDRFSNIFERGACSL